MITHTLSSDPVVSLELGRRIALTERRRRREGRKTLGAVLHGWFVRPRVKLVSAHH